MPVSGGELPDSDAGFVDTGKPERGETDPGRPAFGTVDEGMDVLLGYGNTRQIDNELVRLLTGESQVLRAQLAESPPCTKPAQAPARVRARRDDHP
jgi:hypothetical protein